MAFSVADIDTVVRQLKAGGVVLTGDIAEDERTRTASFKDSEGNLLMVREILACPAPSGGAPYSAGAPMTIAARRSANRHAMADRAIAFITRVSAAFVEGPMPDFDLDTFFETLCSILREADPASKPIPHLMSRGTDARNFARLGIRRYGFLPHNFPEGCTKSAQCTTPMSGCRSALWNSALLRFTEPSNGIAASQER